MGIVHGGGYADVDFDAVASRPVVGAVVEPKVCERCTRQFFRSVMPEQRLREKFCPRCRVKSQSKKPSVGVH